jgi:hypothetical protein
MKFSDNGLQNGERGDNFEQEEGVEAPLSDQIPQKLLKQLQKEDVGKKVVELWNQANNSRSVWLQRQRTFLEELDEFVDPIYTAPLEWSSTLHFPVAFTISKTYHARMFAAVFGQDPPFTTRARKEANVDRAPLIQELMRYTVRDWANYNKGIEDPIDAGIWRWITSGTVVWKLAWEKRFSRYIDVMKEQKQVVSFEVDPETGIDRPVSKIVTEEKEVERAAVTYNGPCVYPVLPEDIVIIGGNGDVDDAEHVIESAYLSASDLWSLADQKVFDKKVVKQIIEAGRDYKTAEPANAIKAERALHAGNDGPDQEYEEDKFQILEAHIRMPVDNSGINSDLVVWVHKNTTKIVRATYLYRMSETGQRPYAKADFYKREGEPFGIGLPELIYTLTKEIDAVHNMRLDFGLLSTMPFGYYRPTSSMSTEKIPIEPGQLVPLDNPQSDVMFPNLGNRTAFGFQEEAALQQMIERVTGISDLSLGVLGAQGAARTATGARAIVGESNANLDIFLRRLNRGLKKLYGYLFGMLQRRLPENFEFRLFGDNGQQYFKTVHSREEIAGKYDFELEPNSANSNKQIQVEVANQVYMMTSNPLDIQLGIVTPIERYESIKALMQAQGIKDYSRYIRKPQGQQRLFTPEEIANRVLSGIDVPLGPEQDLQGFVNYVQLIFDNDDLMGQFNEQQAMTLTAKQMEAQQMMAALQEMAAQQANVQQMRRNSQQSVEQTAPGGGAAPSTGAPSDGNSGPQAA